MWTPIDLVNDLFDLGIFQDILSRPKEGIPNQEPGLAGESAADPGLSANFQPHGFGKLGLAFVKRPEAFCAQFECGSNV